MLSFVNNVTPSHFCPKTFGVREGPQHLLLLFLFHFELVYSHRHSLLGLNGLLHTSLFLTVVSGHRSRVSVVNET